MLTQAELKVRFHYNSQTGIFTHLTQASQRTKIGSIAGCACSGYRNIKIGGSTYKAHRLAWLYVYGRMPVEQIDHINGSKDDNRINNLREATNAQNCLNVGPQKRSASGYKGVTWRKEVSKWRVRCKIDGLMTTVGYFQDLEQAAKAHHEHAKKHHGEFFKDQRKTK